MWWGEGELISLLFTSCTAVVRHRTFLSTSNYRILPPSIGWNTINLGYIGSLKSGNLIFINWKFDMWWNSTVRQKNVRYMRNLIYPLYPEVYRTWISRHRYVNVTCVVIDSTDQWTGAILPLKIFCLTGHIGTSSTSLFFHIGTIQSKVHQNPIIPSIPPYFTEWWELTHNAIGKVRRQDGCEC